MTLRNGRRRHGGPLVRHDSCRTSIVPREGPPGNRIPLGTACRHDDFLRDLSSHPAEGFYATSCLHLARRLGLLKGVPLRGVRLRLRLGRIAFDALSLARVPRSAQRGRLRRCSTTSHSPSAEACCFWLTRCTSLRCRP
jgi:hypothetical protein